MPKIKYTKKEIREEVQRSRQRNDEIIEALSTRMPEGLETIVVVANNFFMSNSLKRKWVGEGYSCRTEEKEFMCDRLYEAKRAPAGKKSYEAYINLVLEVEKESFVAVTCSKEVKDYLYEQCEKTGKEGRYNRLRVRKTGVGIWEIGEERVFDNFRLIRLKRGYGEKGN